MRKTILALLLCITLVRCTSCKDVALSVNIELAQMKNICNLATLECYYHNVAKVYTENAEKTWIFFDVDRNFWIEYGGIVKLGLDASLVTMDVNDTLVTITIPEAQVLECIVDKESLNDDSYIVAQGSAKVHAEDQIAALAEAQKALSSTAAQNKILLSNAQLRAQVLLEEYVKNIGELTGKEYTIQWVYLPASTAEVDSAS